MRLATIVQARMGSKRLPGKVMMDIGGQPLLWHVINNAKQVGEPVIVATPDKQIADYAKKLHVPVFIGDENDVLDRYYHAALEYDVEHIIRITADNPMVDPEMVKKLIRFYFDGKYDWAANCRLKVTYPIGDDAEIFSFDALETAWCSSIDPYEADCVTAYIYRHPELFNLGVMENDTDQSYLKWTVDSQEDLDRVREIYAELRVSPGIHARTC